MIKSSFKIILYDFEIYLDHTLSILGIAKVAIDSNPYNHEANFSSFDIGSLLLEQSKKEVVDITITATSLAHILLSSKEHY